MATRTSVFSTQAVRSSIISDDNDSRRSNSTWSRMSIFDGVIDPFPSSNIRLMCNICGHLQLYLEGIKKETTKQCPNCCVGIMSYKANEYESNFMPPKQLSPWTPPQAPVSNYDPSFSLDPVMDILTDTQDDDIYGSYSDLDKHKMYTSDYQTSQNDKNVFQKRSFPHKHVQKQNLNNGYWNQSHAQLQKNVYHYSSNHSSPSLSSSTVESNYNSPSFPSYNGYQSAIPMPKLKKLSLQPTNSVPKQIKSFNKPKLKYANSYNPNRMKRSLYTHDDFEPPSPQKMMAKHGKSKQPRKYMIRHRTHNILHSTNSNY